MITKTLKSLLLLIILFFIALPYISKYSAIHYLQTEMDIETYIGDITLNPVSGKIGIDDLHLYNNDDLQPGELHLRHLLIDFSISELFNKNILIESITIADFSSNISEFDNGWNIGGIFIPLSTDNNKDPEPDVLPKEQVEKQTFDWGYGIRAIHFSNLKMDINSQYTDSNIKLNKLIMRDMISWYPANNSAIELDLVINDQSISLSGEAKPFLNVPEIKTNVKINDLPLKPFLKSIKDLPYETINAALFSDFQLHVLMQQDQIQLQLQGLYGLKDIYLKDAEREISLDKFIWDGKQSVLIPQTQDQNTEISLEGLLELKQVSVKDKTSNINLQHKNITLNGNYSIKLATDDSAPDITATTTLVLEGFNLDSLDKQIKIASFSDWQINNISVKNIEDVAIQKTEINQLILLKNNFVKNSEKMLTLDKFIVNDIQYSPEQTSIKNITLSQLNANITLDNQGNIAILDAIKNSGQTTDTTQQASDNITLTSNDAIQSDDKNIITETENENKDNPKSVIVINEVQIKNNNSIQFTDNSLTPIFQTKIHDLSLKINDIHSAKPDDNTHIKLSMKIDEYGKLNVTGTTKPFAEKISADLIAKLESIELVPLSSYAGKYVGINIKRGTLDIDANININQDKMDIKNHFTLNQLNVESDNNEISDNVFKDMPMPLDLTLDVLRDKNNIIELDIPVTGLVSDPDFRLQDIYNIAMAKALKFAATHYLMQAVQPLGLVITAGKLIGKATAPSFDPLVFKNGVVKISKTNKNHIKKLAKVLQDKDKLRFTICGAATESDWMAIQKKLKANKSSDKDSKTNSETQNKSTQKKTKDTNKKDQKKKIDPRTQALLKLANDRTKAVKKEFVTVHKIEARRLFACNGKIEKNKAAKPAVKITL